MTTAPTTPPEPGTTPASGPARGTDREPDVRFSYANERTFLAWNRTSLAMVTAGLAITQLLPPFKVPGGRRMIGLPLIAMGTLVAIVSFFQWQRNERAMRKGDPLPTSVLPALVAAVVALSAVIALVLVVVEGGANK